MDCTGKRQFLDDGYVILNQCVSSTVIASAIEAAATLAPARAGVRDPLGRAAAFREIEASALRPIASALLGGDAFPVRSILFDKTPDANWDVVWHQDVTIAVRERIEVDGFGPWSTKAGAPHVQPPASILESMVTLRLHLDDCPAENGPLLVMPRSHHTGFVDVRTLDTAACDRDAVRCTVAAGDVVAMRPLLLHASKKAQSPAHRRVLHVEYAARPLPAGLAWAHGARDIQI